MVGFSPFIGSYIKQDFVRRVPAPAFDSMSAAQRAAYLATHPESYTLVTRSPGDGGPEDDASLARLTELSGEALERIMDADAFTAHDRPAFFLYRLILGDHDQVGIVGLVETADYLAGHVKRHEQVSKERAGHLSTHFETLGVHSAPIALGYRSDQSIRAQLDAILADTEPVLSFTSGDGLAQEVWVVDDEDRCAALATAFTEHELYIMDGHHRAAAGGALAERIGDPRGKYMLGVLFSDDRVNIDPFHRHVTLDDEADMEAIATTLKDALGLRPDPSVATSLPELPGELGVYLDGMWWRGSLPAPLGETSLDAIDPVRLQEQVIGPLLGVDPERSIGKINYFLDDIDRDTRARRLGDHEILFVLQAVTPAEVFAVADEGLDMPPKSTYVTPKPRSGVFLRQF